MAVVLDFLMDSLTWFVTFGAVHWGCIVSVGEGNEMFICDVGILAPAK